MGGRMNPAFERHAAYMAQAWRTLQDSMLLKDNTSTLVGPNRGKYPQGYPAGEKPNIARLVADNPGATSHCETEGCNSLRTRNSPYCAPCLQAREDANLQD